jgi:hypothetical protein
VADQLEIRGPHGERLLVPVRHGSFVVGSAPDADVRLAWPGVAAQHFRFVRVGAAVRVEPVQAGGTVEVNGEALFCKDLAAGDRIDVAGVHLRWLPDAGAPPPRAAAAPATTAGHRRRPPRRDDSRPRHRARSRPVPTGALVAVGVLAVLGLAFVVFRALSGSTWPSSPQSYVDLARAQMENRQYQRALDTLAFAMREATGRTRAEAQQLEADIRKLMVETAEMPRVLAARSEHDQLLGFVSRYLRDGSTRPAARELVRLCDGWLERHAEVCGRHADGQPLLRTVEELRARHLPMAGLPGPDTADDVVFAARSRLRFQWRDYRGAIARLDAFLAAQPAEESVRRERAAIVAEGEQWLAGKFRHIDLLLQRGDLGNAEDDLAQLERWSVLPEWLPQLEERKRRLAARR